MGGAQFLEKSLCKVISLQLIKINEKKKRVWGNLAGWLEFLEEEG